MRLGLCCGFVEHPVKFRTATAAAMLRKHDAQRVEHLARLCLVNARALTDSIQYCAAHGIGAFRVNSGLLPLSTHPQLRYRLEELPLGSEIVRALQSCRRLSRRLGIRLTLHPDQFVVLNSPRQEVVDSSLEELHHQTRLARWIGADVITLHGGGAYGDKPSALQRLEANIRQLPIAIRRVLTLENDDTVFTPEDLIPLCRRLGIPMVYDVHHHRCLPDGLSVAAATKLAMGTWRREPLFHVSSPLGGWSGPHIRRHHDYVCLRDVPAVWRTLTITVDVEAKAKELAVKKLQHDLSSAALRRARKRVTSSVA